MKSAILFLFLLLSTGALATEYRKDGVIWCAIPENFNGKFAAAFYAYPELSGEAWMINLGTGGFAAKADIPRIKKTGNVLRGRGFVGTISNLKPNRFTAHQVVFDLKVNASIPAGSTVGAPTSIQIDLECAAYEGALKKFE